MLKVLDWYFSNDMTFQNDALKILSRQHDGVEIIGGAAGEDIIKFARNDFDIILVVGARKIGMNKVIQAAQNLNLPEEKLLGDWVVRTPGFTLEKYRRLQSSNPSILSVNCMGGILSNTLGLPFRSPFINFYLSGADFIKFLSKPHEYLAEKLIYKGHKLNSTKTIEFPVVALGDILINMVHYKSFEDSVEAWEKRKTRINWDNLFIMTWTTSQKELEQFDALSYAKKVCFVPFKSDLDSAWYLEHGLKEKFPMYVHFVIETTRGNLFYYDPFDMLLYGKKTPLIEM